MKYRPYLDYALNNVVWLNQTMPSHWKVERLKSFIQSSINGVWGNEPQQDKNDLICVRVADFDYTKLTISDDQLTLRNIEPNQQATRLLDKDDLLIEKSGGGDLQPVGRVVSFNLNVPSVCSNFVGRLIPSLKINNRFLCYVFYATYSARLNTRAIKQTTGIQNLDLEAYLNERFAVPSPAEQQAIADFLDRETGIIDTLIAKKQALIERLQEKRTALISHTVTKGLDPTAPMKDSGIEWLGQIPAHWQTIRSKWLFALRKTKAYPSDRQITVSQKYGPIYQDDFVELEGRRVMEVIKGADILLHIEPNDFVISMRSFQGGIEHSKIRGSVSSAYVVLIPAPSVQMDFYAHLLKSSQYIQALQGTTNLIRDGQAIRYSHFILVDLPVVPPDEQAQIAEYLDRETAQIDTLIQKLKEAITRLKEYRTALISAVVTGKIDVRNHAQGEF